MRVLFLLPALAALLAPVSAGAQATATAVQSVRVVVRPAVSLTVTPATLTFSRAETPGAPVLPAEGPVEVRARARTATNASLLLTVTAEGDLVGDGGRIEANALGWFARGEGFRSGALAAGRPVLAAAWTGPGERSGALFWQLRADFPLPAGEYATRLVYTLLAP